MTELIRGIAHLTPSHQGCVATIGNFDGVHLGHQALLARLKASSQALGVPGLVMIFEPQPLEFFTTSFPARLTRWREKFCLLSAAGVERVLVIRFNAFFAALSAEAFVRDLLYQRLGVKHVIVGEDFKFGRGREGNVSTLKILGEGLGLTVEAMPSILWGNERVSSTRIRKALAEANHELAEHLLGRPYCMMGRVVYGTQLGRQLGFPTANIDLHRAVSPILGIYAVRLRVGEEKGWPGVAYIGTRPTLDGTRTILEVHLLDVDEHLYGKYVCVEFYKKLRDDKRFDNIDLLKQQIAIDTEQARNYFYG